MEWRNVETKFNVSMPHFSAMESPIVLMDLMKTVIYVQKVSIVFFQNHNTVCTEWLSVLHAIRLAPTLLVMSLLVQNGHSFGMPDY
jgi:hypothetical protein